MYGQWEGELWFHRWHMWPVPSSSTPSVAAPASSFVFIDSNSFSKDGRKINVGDCALFKPPYNSLPFVGRIRKLKLGKENNISLCVNWLYRPADVKLKEGASVKAAPNEVFYSFHKDEIPAASLLHPCKVTFLRKGVEFPSGVSSFVCRQVYDVESGRLFWLTDRNYLNELQEEVDQLLGKTFVEMHGAVQTGGRSSKPLNGSGQLKPTSDNVQNSSSSISSHAKSKKREHGGHYSESVKRERLSKVDDADSGQLRPEKILKTEIAKITDKGGLVDIGGVEKLIKLMRPESTDKKLNLACRTMLVDVISSTDRFDCLGRFAHLKGLLVLDEWLQEIHKGKIGDGSFKENDKSVEQFLFSLLRALDKLPVNLHALQTCNVGKSVNHLRSHKNSEIQKKARSLVNTWKRRVEAEMNIIETKSGTSRGGSWPHKPVISEVPHMDGTRRTGGGSSEVALKTSALKAPQPKSPTSHGSTKLSPSSATKEGRSCSSSQSPNNSQSCSSVSHSKNSGNGFNGAHKEGGILPTRVTTKRLSDNGNNQRLIVRLPNRGQSLTQTASLESPEDSSTLSGKGSLPAPSTDKKLSGKIDSLQENNVTNTNTNTHTNTNTNMGDDDLARGKGLIVRDEEHGKKDASVGSGSSSGVTPKPGNKLYEPSYSSINALVESCAKISEASVSPPIGDVGGINLLASVAAGEMSRSDVSPSSSPDCDSPVLQNLCSENADKLRQVAHDVGHSEDNNISVANNNTGSMNMTSEVKPLEEDKCPDIKPVRNTVGSLDAVATSVKPEITQNNEDLASWSSSDMHEDEKKLVHKQLTEQPVATTSCGDVCLAPKSEEVDEKKPLENIEKDDKAPVTEASCVVDRTVKLDFDLNEVFPSDDVVQCGAEKADVHAPSSLPSNNKNGSVLVTVAAAAKGPFYPSESFSRGKLELGWKGSAATSAFRPAEPRKVDVLVPDNRTSKQTHTLFDFDLNVGVDDADQQNAPSGFDLDLNACEDTPETVKLTVSTSSRPFKSTLPGLDLNGPGMEEVGGESVNFSKNGMQFISGVSNARMNNMNTGNFSTWFPANNTYQPITIPSQRMLTPLTSNSSFNPEVFRGPILSSSPAVAYPSTVPYQYSAFPFETNFSLPSISNTFSSVSNVFVDSPSSSGGPICFPTIPPVGPNGVVSMPYYTSLPGGSSHVGPDGRKWGSQGLDLNAGSGDGKVATTLRQLPLGGTDEQLRMFHQLAAGGGGSGGGPKRKEPDGGWDGDNINRISYKHPHRQ